MDVYTCICDTWVIPKCFPDNVNDYSDILENNNVDDYTKTVTVFKELLANVTE